MTDDHPRTELDDRPEAFGKPGLHRRTSRQWLRPTLGVLRALALSLGAVGGCLWFPAYQEPLLTAALGLLTVLRSKDARLSAAAPVTRGEAVLRVAVRSPELHPIVLTTGEHMRFGRAPHPDVRRPGHYAVAVPGCAPHVSRVLGELVVAESGVRITWRGSNEAMLASLFEAPGGARRVTLMRGMSTTLDDGKNELVVFTGRQADGYATDLTLTFLVTGVSSAGEPTGTEASIDARAPGVPATQEAPQALRRHSKDWFVALALTEPLMAGEDDEVRAPTYREIHRRVCEWRGGDAWNLADARRVDEAIKRISRIAFGEAQDPYLAARDGKLFNARFAVARRVAQRRLVTSEDLDEVSRAAGRASGA